MMLSEFEKLTGLEVTTAEYEKIEAEYMESPDDKAKFCKMWLKKRGLQRLHNARLEEIEHLKKTIEDLEHKLGFQCCFNGFKRKYIPPHQVVLHFFSHMSYSAISRFTVLPSFLYTVMRCA